MNSNAVGISVEESRELAQRTLEVYEAVSPQGQTLGDWVLDAYPELFLEHALNGRDFYYAQRPTDAKYYLIGLLEDGSLNAKVLRDYLATQLETSNTR